MVPDEQKARTYWTDGRTTPKLYPFNFLRDRNVETVGIMEPGILLIKECLYIEEDANLCKLSLSLVRFELTSPQGAVYLRCTYPLYYKDNTSKYSTSLCTNLIVEQQTYSNRVALFLIT